MCNLDKVQVSLNIRNIKAIHYTDNFLTLAIVYKLLLLKLSENQI